MKASLVAEPPTLSVAMSKISLIMTSKDHLITMLKECLIMKPRGSSTKIPNGQIIFIQKTIPNLHIVLLVLKIRRNTTVILIWKNINRRARNMPLRTAMETLPQWLSLPNNPKAARMSGVSIASKDTTARSVVEKGSANISGVDIPVRNVVERGFASIFDARIIAKNAEKNLFVGMEHENFRVLTATAVKLVNTDGMCSSAHCANLQILATMVNRDPGVKNVGQEGGYVSINEKSTHAFFAEEMGFANIVSGEPLAKRVVEEVFVNING